MRGDTRQWRAWADDRHGIRWTVFISEDWHGSSRSFSVWREPTGLAGYMPAVRVFSSLHKARKWARRVVDISNALYDVDSGSTHCAVSWFYPARRFMSE